MLTSFEAAKDSETGLWSIPSRDGYPADGYDNMKNAANAFIGLKVLDMQTDNRQDHSELGVVEPNLDDLEVGDEGIGRLVTFTDSDGKKLASLIVGNELEDEEGKIYVRIPGEDPVYVVKLDSSALTTDFQKWIESDLLKMSSIDVEDLELKDYSASLRMTNQGATVGLEQNYTANLVMDGSQWKLDKLVDFKRVDPGKPPVPTPYEMDEDDKLNTTKLNNLKNSLDDLKIVDVEHKPDGMSASLRANKDLNADPDAQGSLIKHGFYAIPTADNQYEVISANGEMTVGLKDGVEYVLRFGNVAGLTEDSKDDAKDDESSEEDDENVAGGLNRYLLVTTRVNEAKFPAPELKPVPQSLEELEKMRAAENEDTVAPEPPAPAESVDAAKAEETNEKDAGDGAAEEKDAESAKENSSDDAEMKEEKAEDASKEDAAEKSEEPASETTESKEDAAESKNQNQGRCCRF